MMEQREGQVDIGTTGVSEEIRRETESSGRRERETEKYR